MASENFDLNDKAVKDLFDLMAKYGGKYDVRDFYEKWYNVSKYAINSLKLQAAACIDRQSLVNMLKSCLPDIVQLDKAALGEKVYTIKEFAYSTFAYLRSAPIQIRHEDGERTSCANERVAACMLISQFVPLAASTDLRRISLNALADFFKSKTYTPKTIEERIMALTVWIEEGTRFFTA